MKERPILFNAEMVRATLHGIKTQTRRVVVPPRNYTQEQFWAVSKSPAGVSWEGHGDGGPGTYDKFQPCPYGQIGDRLWVREAWRFYWPYGEPGVHRQIQYRADCETRMIPPLADDEGCMLRGPSKWKPSIHMSRKDSRLMLEITDVHVEKIKQISNADILAEGIRPEACKVCIHGSSGCGDCHALWHPFRDLWNSINANRGYGWDTNPLVWVITFKRLYQ